MFAQAIYREINQRNISIRQAAREIGVSHTTLARTLDGKPIDLDTLLKMGSWLSLSAADTLTLYGFRNAGEGQEVFELARLITLDPDLMEAISQIITSSKPAHQQAEIMRGVCSYAGYLINRAGEGG